MQKYDPADAFFEAMPIYITPVNMEMITESQTKATLENLEEDVKTEEKYLQYLFHYKKDI